MLTEGFCDADGMPDGGAVRVGLAVTVGKYDAAADGVTEAPSPPVEG